MHVIFLDSESASRPGVRFANPVPFLFHKCCNLSGQVVFPVLGTPDKVIGSFVGDVFGVLCLHTRYCNMCSNPCEVPVRAALPLLER